MTGLAAHPIHAILLCRWHKSPFLAMIAGEIAEQPSAD
jgi:hypothetical protein